MAKLRPYRKISLLLYCHPTLMGSYNHHQRISCNHPSQETPEELQASEQSTSKMRKPPQKNNPAFPYRIAPNSFDVSWLIGISSFQKKENSLSPDFFGRNLLGNKLTLRPLAVILIQQVPVPIVLHTFSRGSH